MVYRVSVVVSDGYRIHSETSHGPFEYAMAAGLEMFDWFRTRLEGQRIDVYVGFDWDFELMSPLAILTDATGSLRWRLNGQRN